MVSAITTPLGGAESEQSLLNIHQLIQTTFKEGDVIFLASSDKRLSQELIERRLVVIPLNSQDYESSVRLLGETLDQVCSSADFTKGNFYFVWTDEGPYTIANLGPVTRPFFFFTDAVKVEPTGHILRLAPKEYLISRYCKVRPISKERLVMIVIAADKFPPSYIGGVWTGNTIWLASNDLRDIGPGSWSFTHQETQAFAQGIQQISAQDGLILVDQEASLGKLAQMFLQPCPENKLAVGTDLFIQMCPVLSDSSN
jgi:hypothetical protein